MNLLPHDCNVKVEVLNGLETRNEVLFLMFIDVDMDDRESRVLYSSKLPFWTVAGWSCSFEDSPKTT